MHDPGISSSPEEYIIQPGCLVFDEQHPPPPRLPGGYRHYRIGDGVVVDPSLDLLGRGLLGSVWAATSDRYPGIPLAIKFLAQPSPDWMRREAELSLHLHHECIAHTLEFLDLQNDQLEPGQWSPNWPPAAIVMERYNVSLQTVVGSLRRKNEPLPFDIALQYLKEIARALKAVHQLGWVHRDVKPSNILLRLSEERLFNGRAATLVGSRALLADFGVAVPFGAINVPGLRDDGWKAPEILDESSERQYHTCPAQDVYAFGLLIETLEAIFPAHPATEGESPGLHDRGPLADLRKLCLSHCPEDRPEASALVAWLDVAPFLGNSREQPEDDLCGWLRSVAHVLGVSRGTLFLRERGTGAFPVVGTLAETDGATPEVRYAFDEGRTGWVAENGKPLRILDCDDRDEFLRVRPRLNPSSHQPWWDTLKERVSYLCVPVLGGDDVLGLLRFVCKTPRLHGPVPGKTHFTALDEELAQAAAVRLGHRLFKQYQQQYDSALRLALTILEPPRSAEEVYLRISQAIESGVGKCILAFRRVDWWDAGEGTPHQVLQLAYSNPVSGGWPETRLRDDGLAGHVWTTRTPHLCVDVRTDPVIQEMRQQGYHEFWWEKYHSAVSVPLLGGQDEFLGVFTVHRTPTHGFLKADVSFIQQVAHLAGLALQVLGENEKLQIKQDILSAFLLYYQGRDEGIRRDQLETMLLERLCVAFRRGLSRPPGTARCRVWRYNERRRHYEGLAPSGSLSPGVVRQALGEPRIVVVSDPGRDGRLHALLDALPQQDRDLVRTSQHAAVLLDESTRFRVLPPSLFLLIARPPLRLSYKRIELLRGLLSGTIGWGQPDAHLLPEAD